MDKHCGICRNTSCSNHGKNISFLGDGWKCNYIPVPTNADRIRAMSDKELAELMRSMMDCDSCGNMFSFKCDGSYEHCSSVCLKWLQQPAEEDDHD